LNGHELRDDLKPLLAEFKAGMTSFGAIHVCIFDREWSSTHRGVDYGGCAFTLTEISVALEELCGRAAGMAAQPESLTTFRDYFGALLPFLDASRDCVNGLQAYCVSMNGLVRGRGGSIAEAHRLKELYIRLGVRMNAARASFRAASARWGF